MTETYTNVLTHLKEFPPLRVEQYQEIRNHAEERVKELIGEKPNSKDYTVSMVGVFTIMDWIIFALYILLLCFSLIHVFLWAGKEAAFSFSALSPESISNQVFAITNNGFQISQGAYIIVHQVSLLGVSELGIVGFSMFHAYRGKYELKLQKATTIYGKVYNFVNHYFFLILALLCAIVVFVANMSSNFNLFVSFLIPVLTVSLSERFSHLFSKSYEFQLDTELRYKNDLENWTTYTSNPNQHPEFLGMLGAYIVEFYKRRRLGRDFLEWSKDLEDLLAAREIQIHHTRKSGIEAAMDFLANPTTE